MFATKLKQVNKIIRIGTNDLDPLFIKSNVIKESVYFVYSLINAIP